MMAPWIHFHFWLLAFVFVLLFSCTWRSMCSLLLFLPFLLQRSKLLCRLSRGEFHGIFAPSLIVYINCGCNLNHFKNYTLRYHVHNVVSPLRVVWRMLVHQEHKNGKTDRSNRHTATTSRAKSSRVTNSSSILQTEKLVARDNFASSMCTTRSHTKLRLLRTGVRTIIWTWFDLLNIEPT